MALAAGAHVVGRDGVQQAFVGPLVLDGRVDQDGVDAVGAARGRVGVDVLAASRFAVGVVPAVFRPVGSPDVQLVRQLANFWAWWRARVELAPQRPVKGAKGLLIPFGAKRCLRGALERTSGLRGKGGTVGATGLDNLQPCCRGVVGGCDGVRHAAMRIPSGAGRGWKSGG